MRADRAYVHAGLAEIHSGAGNCAGIARWYSTGQTVHKRPTPKHNPITAPTPIPMYQRSVNQTQYISLSRRKLSVNTGTVSRDGVDRVVARRFTTVAQNHGFIAPFTCASFICRRILSLRSIVKARMR